MTRTMDFFGRQERARRRTVVLVGCLALAVILMIAAIYSAVVLALHIAKIPEPQPINWYQPKLLALVAVITLTIIFVGCLYKMLELRGGGEQVAAMLGGKKVNPATEVAAEKRLLNVVEEMAIASGMAVPAVYLLDREFGINAFAAGYTPDDAVIGISRGALEYLSRDELQGVVAHEFSHILNGDMRFNLRLIGILHGILVIGLIGYYLLRTGDGSSRSSGSGKGGWWILLVGLTMFVVGYVGLFFGRVIKAAVSRQREYLADASAVQFTRNPQGVSGALKKIGGLAGHSYVEVPTAETASHMFFGSAFRHGRYSPFATHPPLVDRVRAVEPKFDGTFPEVRAIARPKPPAKPSLRKRLADRRAPTGATLPERGINETLPLEPAMVLSAVGAPTMDHMHYAAHWLASLPESLAAAVREPYGARCVVFALLLDGRAHMCGHQLQLLTDLEDKPTMLETERLAEQLATTGRSARLPLVDLAQGTLRQLSPGQYAQFRKTADRLIRADEKVSFFEFVIQCVLLSHLDRKFAEQKPPPVRYYSIRGATEEVVILLSALARVGQRDIRSAETAFQQAIVPLPLSGPGIVLQPAEQCTLSRIQSALQKLATCSMPVKKRVLGAATLCVAADGMVTVAEAELLRAVADSLDCPIPPILPGKVNRSEQRSS